jgi:selenide,water dikinase
MPVDKIPVEMVREILKGGAAVCATAGIPVAGGHSIDCPEPVYGLAVIGTCHPSQVRRNSDARPGDALILTKPVGVGIYSAAIKKSALPPAAYQEMIAATTTLNKVGAELGMDARVHAVTDVTGFGVLGHALELARGSGLTVVLQADAVPLLKDAAALAEKGFVTGASHRNWASYGHDVALPSELPEWKRHLLSDPQTSGGLLVSCDTSRANDVLAKIKAAGLPSAAIIGRTESGKPAIKVV